MRVFKRVVCSAVILVMFTTNSIFAAETTVAPDKPSNWALWDVQMASIYGLGNVENYNQYKVAIKGSQFLSVQASLEQKFGVADTNKVALDKAMNRGNVIDELYDVIELALKLEASTNESASIDYFAKNGLIQGINGNYSLGNVCTQQEMLVFSKRVYDFLTYGLGLDAKGAFWKVSDGDNTVYLLGSIHATDGTVYPLSKAILTAFVNSDAVVVEANILSQTPEEIAYIQQIMMIQGDGTIDQLLSKEVYDAYVTLMQSVGVPVEVYSKLKPWAAAMTVESILMANASYTASLGIDVFFLSMASNRMPILELEGAKYQIDMFDSFSPELQEVYLAGALTGSEASDATVKEMLKLWKAGDMEGLEALVFGSEATTEVEKEFNDKLWIIRNKKMLDKVKDMLVLDTEHDYFVIVGAGHMLNEDGIVQGLIDLGYTVERVK